jgi:hypothetical protein
LKNNILDFLDSLISFLFILLTSKRGTDY